MAPVTPAQIKAKLSEFGLAPNRALGQNFFADAAALSNIVRHALPFEGPVLEIGPGLGALTCELAQHAPKVVAFEIDSHIIPALESVVNEFNNIEIVNRDFLDVDLESVYCSLGRPEKLYIAANLPYFITTPASMKLLDTGMPIASITLTLQREAAERFTASPSDGAAYGPLSILAQHYYDVKTVLELPPGCFYPQPKVASRVIKLVRRADTVFKPGFGRFLKAAFAMRRKTLINNLQAAGFNREQAEGLLEACGLPPGIRAEAMPPAALAELFDSMSLIAQERGLVDKY